MKLQSMNLNALKRPLVLITVGVVILVAILWWMLWMSPQGNKLNTANAEQANLNGQLQTLNATLQHDKAQAARVQLYAGYLGMFAAAVPPVPEAPQLTTELADLANATNVKLTTLTDDTTVAGTPVSTIPLTMEIQGPRQDCLAFLAGIYDPKLITRLITINSFTPTPLNAGPGGVNVLKPSDALYTANIAGNAYYDPEIDPSATSGTVTATTTAAVG
jgi:Tfp pilus assembly protein PilO